MPRISDITQATDLTANATILVGTPSGARRMTPVDFAKALDTLRVNAPQQPPPPGGEIPAPPPGDTGTPWAGAWTTGEDSAGGVQDINGDPRLASPAVANQASWATVIPGSADYEARLSLRMPVVNTDYTVSCYIRPNADFTNRFELKLNMSAETITLVRRDAGVETSLGLSTAFDFVADQRVHFRIWAVGTSIKARWWRDLDPEPLTWNYDITVSQHLTNARFGVAVRAGALASSRTVYMSDFILRDAPTSTPPPTPIGSTQAFASGTTAADVGFTNQTGTVAPTAGVLRNTATSTDAVAYYTYDTLSTDHYVSADLVIGSSGTGVSAGLTARHSTSASTYYLLETDNGITNIKLNKVVAGTKTQLGSTYTANLSINTTYQLRLEVQGRSIRGYLGTTLVCSAVDTSITSGTRGGVKINPGAATNRASIDNFAVGSLITSVTNQATLVTQDFNSGANAAAVGFTDMLPGVHGTESAIILDAGRVQVGNGSSIRNANAYANVDMVTPDHWVEGDLIIGTTVANQYCGIMARVSNGATGPYSFYKLECCASTSQVRIACVVNNALGTPDAWTAPYPISPNTTYRLRLVCVGTSIRGYINNTRIFDIVDTQLQNQTRVGVNVGRIDNTLASAWIDNFAAGNFLTGGSNGGGSGSTGGISFTEAFGSGTTGADANFTMVRGTLAISGGTLRAGATSTEIDGYHNTDLGSANHYVEADIIVGATEGTTYCALNARMATSGLTYYSIETSFDRSTLELIRVSSGTYTSLGTYTTGWALNTTHKVRLECSGSNIKVYVDGTERMSVTDTGITGGTKVGVHMFTDSVTKMTIDNFVGAAAAGSVVTPPPVSDPGTGTGKFRTIGRHIVDPAGYKFIPVGMNCTVAPQGVTAGTYWNDGGLGNATGRSTLYKDTWKCNFMRINMWFDPAGGHTLTQRLNGMYDAIDEYVAKGIVVMPSWHEYTADPPNDGQPTWATLQADATFMAFLDGLVARYKNQTSGYVWLNPLNEPWRYANLNGWHATGTAMYNYIRQAGWNDMFVWDLPGWGQGIETSLVPDSYLANFLTGKTNTVYGFHNYNHASPTARAQDMNARGYPVIVGETAMRDMRENYIWCCDQAYSIGWGLVFWWGAGNRNDNLVLRIAVGATFYDTQYALNEHGTRFQAVSFNPPLPQRIA